MTRVVRPPVEWLLGPEMLGKLRSITRTRIEPRAWMHVEKAHDEGSKDGEVWFDYLADTGDAGDATYAAAYATYVRFRRSPGTKLAPGTELIPVLARENDEACDLPLGKFLFIGGDTAYHVADEVTLRTRVLEPFAWAYSDALTGEFTDATKPRRPLYGIPGNHDWYDDLRGFSLVFYEHPPQVQLQNPKNHGPQKIELPGFKPVQLASYFAIDLPGGWQIWGLDIDQGLDPKQLEYFQKIANEKKKAPRRLIVATPSPPIVCGAVAPHPKHDEAIKELGLTLVHRGGKLEDGERRIDLSGDVHHYARYGGEPGAEYAAVVSGLGGAFHHPSFTQFKKETDPNLRELCSPKHQFPTPGDSLEAVAPRLLSPLDMLRRSWLRVLPFFMANIVGFASISHDAGWLPNTLLRDAGLVTWSKTAGTVEDAGRAALLLGVSVLGLMLVAVGIWLGIKVHGILEDDARKANAVESSLWSRIDPRRNYEVPWALALFGLSVIVFYPIWIPWLVANPLPDSWTAVLDCGTYVICLVPLVGAVFAFVVGGARLPIVTRVGLGTLGLLHGVAQVISALLCSRIAFVNVETTAATGAIILLGFIALLASWLLFKRPGALVIFAIAVVTWSVAMGALIYFAAPETIEYGQSCAELRLLAGGLVAVVLGAVWFTFYLAIAGLVNGHNNEVGGAARVTKFRQIVRFCVSTEGVTGYVIRIEDKQGKSARDEIAQAERCNLKFVLEDIIHVKS